MTLAILPFNAGENASAPLGRQLANFCGEAVRASTGAEINQVSFLTQIEQDGIPRAAMINVAEGLIERQMLEQIFQQPEVSHVMDGLLTKSGNSGHSLEVRIHSREEEKPVYEEKFDFMTPGLFPVLRSIMAKIAETVGATWPPIRTGDNPLEGALEFGPDGPSFGTENPQAFLDFLEGYDAVIYIQQAQGRVVNEFSPEPAIASLLQSAEADVDFEGPYQGLIALCRMCAANRLGSFESVESALKKLEELRPKDFTAYFGLGEVYQAVGNGPRASDEYEKAALLQPEDPALWARLGLAQMQTDMPINAERNFRKAFELEGDDKPSADYIAMALAQTNRQHEIPGLWKDLIEKHPQTGIFHAKYGLALAQSGDDAASEKAFENALTTVEDKGVIKRFYAPVLANKGELDRAMDFYEDSLDVAPNDIPLLVEYCQTLQKAERTFEIPPHLQTILASNPDQNTRAQTLAWLIEIEQPKRVESVNNALTKAQSGDAQGALRDLRPLRNWLADYWKFWALFASCLNQVGEHIEAEESSRKLLELFPGSVEGYGELANALDKQNRQEEAYQIMKIGANNIPNALPMHVNLGLAARRAGHRDEAREIAKRLREAVGSNEELEPVFAEMER